MLADPFQRNRGQWPMHSGATTMTVPSSVGATIVARMITVQSRGEEACLIALAGVGPERLTRGAPAAGMPPDVR